MRLRLVVDVEYREGTTTEPEMKDQLRCAVDHLTNNGMLTGDGPAEVETFRAEIIDKDTADDSAYFIIRAKRLLKEVADKMERELLPTGDQRTIQIDELNEASEALNNEIDTVMICAR